jgi:large subunit ribosomal protein L4
MKSALSSKCASEEIIVVDKIATDDYKTKTMVEMLNAIDSKKKTLIVLPEVDKKVIKSASNIPGVKTCQVNELNVYDILNADKLVIAEEAVAKIEEVYA